MTETTRSIESLWRQLPDVAQMKRWRELVPDAPERAFREIERDARFIRRYAAACLASALCVVLGSSALSFYSATHSSGLASAAAAGGGTATAASIVLSGRALQRRPRTRPAGVSGDEDPGSRKRGDR